ncbi:MAG: PilT/PilU family type 4a pilus ATPase [Oscillospiraceae bacterium]|nr:PilT/PilU family type 4a pilus ATPase [Oscillospiraceae bacterium]
MDLKEYLLQAVNMHASDIFIGSGRKVLFRIGGLIVPQGERAATPADVEKMVTGLYEIAGRPIERYNKDGDDDFSVQLEGAARFRVSAFRQRGTMAAVIRVVALRIPDYTQLRIPDEIMGIASAKSGLVLVTGPAGSGKTTTLACILDRVNQSRNCHIITLEDPIEYLHEDNRSVINQREISIDTGSYITALRASLRQSPNIILLGEMRDLETISTAMTAAETGHLVISTLHTSGAVNTLDRIIDVFPPGQQQQIRVQLSMALRTVASQQLLPDISGGLVPAFEIMHVNNAVRTYIREGKTHQIDAVIETSSNQGMISMDASISNLFKNGHITRKTVIDYSEFDLTED